MSHISTFVARRFEELLAILNASGYLLDFSGREHPRWEDDPPLGLVHMRAVFLPDADEDEDAEPDERITFTLLERWSEHPYLTRNSARASTYAATPTTDRPATPVFATSSTPTGTPSPPYHLHPPGAPDHIRQPAQATTPETALSELSALIATERAAGRL